MECPSPGGATYQWHAGSGVHFLWLLPGALHLLSELFIEPGWIGTPRWSRTAGGYDALLAKEEVSQPGFSVANPFCAAFFFQAEDGIRDGRVTGVQTCALPISGARRIPPASPARADRRCCHDR